MHYVYVCHCVCVGVEDLFSTINRMLDYTW